MLPDRRESRCRVIGLSPSGAVLVTPERAEIGAVIIAYVNGLGRLEGKVAGLSAAGLHVAFDEDGAQAQRLREKLKAQGPDGRRAPRVALSNTQSGIVVNGISLTAKVRDISLTGAALETEARPEIGAIILVGRMRARVVRHFAEGIAVEFLREGEGEAAAEADLSLLAG